MKKRISVLWIFFVIMVLLATPLSFGQRDFHMVEKKLVEKFKMADAKFQKGKDLFVKEKYAKAETELKKCLEIMPEHAEAYFFLSQIDYKKGNLEQALANIEKAKNNYEFIGQLYNFTHQERLEALRDEQMRLENELPQLQDALARTTREEEKQKIQISINQIKNSISQISARLNEPIPPALQIPAEYYYFHGNILFKLKNFQEAHVQYKEAVKTNPRHENAYNNLINLFFMIKNYEGALYWVNQAESNGVEVNPELKKAVLKGLNK